MGFEILSFELTTLLKIFVSRGAKGLRVLLLASNTQSKIIMENRKNTPGFQV
jgi:hypothetical protein